MHTHYVYNRNGRCLAGLTIDPGATATEAVDAYLERSGGICLAPPMWDNGTRYMWFLEGKGKREYNRYIVRAHGMVWS